MNANVRAMAVSENEAQALRKELGIAEVMPKVKMVPVSFKQYDQDGNETETVEKVMVRECRLRQLQSIALAAAPIIGAIKATKGLDTLDIAGMIARQGDDVAKFLQHSLEKDADWVGELGIDDTIELTFAVLEVNLDFFTQRLIPLLFEKASLLSNVLPRTGASPLSSSV